ncbi:MAG: amidohydrolase family protein [Acidobacteriota bacterium]|nr:amidohydrolase family protein [Acidobacteriota bacterium]
MSCLRWLMSHRVVLSLGTGVRGLSVALVVFTVGCGEPLPEVDGDVAFVGVAVLPMDGAETPTLLENRTVVVTDRRIESISPTDTVDVAEGVLVVEAEGFYLMPGLAEMHGHLPGPRLMQVDARNLLFLYVANGVTTVRGMQGERSQLRLRGQIARGEVIGPRLFVGSRSLTGSRVTTPDEGEQLVRQYKEIGYDLVKIHEGLSRDVFDRVAMTATEVGLPFGGHVPDDVGLFRALEMGQLSIDHLDNFVEALVPDELQPDTPLGFGNLGRLLEVIDEERLPSIVDATQAAGAWIVPTMVLWETAFFGGRSASELGPLRPELRYMPPETVEQWERAIDGRVAGADLESNREVAALRRRILSALHRAGVPILLGTDSPQIFSVPGFAMHHEMALWVEVGMTPYEVLNTGTRRVAEYFGATDDFGSVAVGHRADLLLLTANPLDDIGHVAERAGVMVNGRWLPEADIQARLAGMAQFYGH